MGIGIGIKSNLGTFKFKASALPVAYSSKNGGQLETSAISLEAVAEAKGVGEMGVKVDVLSNTSDKYVDYGAKYGKSNADVKTSRLQIPSYAIGPNKTVLVTMGEQLLPRQLYSRKINGYSSKWYNTKEFLKQ